jgi:endonuclease/exonuclease/phosphatase family metal-dependent hydrolase
MLRVMSLNLNYYGTKHGAWPARRALIRDLIVSSDVDVIALQAVRSAPEVEDGLDQATQLALALPEYQYVVYQPADNCDAGATQGSAFLSRIEIAETDYLELTLLPGLEDVNHRVVLHARFDLPGGPLHLFNGHVSWVYDQARDNLDQIVPYIDAFPGEGLLVGDLNQTPEVDLLRQFTVAGWSDVWGALHSDEPGATFEADLPAIRIDYAWANRALAPHAAAIAVIGKSEETGTIRLSDHLALLVDFDVETWRG